MNRIKTSVTLFAVALSVLTWMSASTAVAQPAPTIIQFPWDWHIFASPNVGTGANPIPGDPVPIWLWGNATMTFGQPQLTGLLPGFTSAPPTFDLGPGGGLGALTPEPVPMGGIYTIPIELVALELHSMMPVDFPGGTSDVIIRLDPSQPSRGSLQNVSSNPDGSINVDSFFDIFTEISLPQVGMELESGPVGVGMSFGDTAQPLPQDQFGPPAPPLPQLDILWAPTWIWRIFPPGTAPPWVDPSLHPWDWWVEIHGHVTIPEPQSLALLALSSLGLMLSRRR